MAPSIALARDLSGSNDIGGAIDGTRVEVSDGHQGSECIATAVFVWRNAPQTGTYRTRSGRSATRTYVALSLLPMWPMGNHHFGAAASDKGEGGGRSKDRTGPRAEREQEPDGTKGRTGARVGTGS